MLQLMSLLFDSSTNKKWISPTFPTSPYVLPHPYLLMSLVAPPVFTQQLLLCLPPPLFSYTWPHPPSWLFPHSFPHVFYDTPDCTSASYTCVHTCLCAIPQPPCPCSPFRGRKNGRSWRERRGWRMLRSRWGFKGLNVIGHLLLFFNFFNVQSIAEFAWCHMFTQSSFCSYVFTHACIYVHMGLDVHVFECMLMYTVNSILMFPLNCWTEFSAK